MLSRTQHQSIVVATLVILSTVAIASPVQAAGSTALSVQPGSQTIEGGTTTTVDIVVEDVSGGVGSYEFTLTSSDPSVASITAVDAQGGQTDVSISDDGSQVNVTAALVDTVDSGTDVSIATVRLAGGAAGTADLALTVDGLGDESGNSYSVTGAQNGAIDVLPSMRIDGLHITPNTVDEGTTVSHQTTFDIVNLSDDGNTDTIDVIYPADTGITVDNIAVTSRSGNAIPLASSPSVQRDTNNRTVVEFAISPDGSVDTSRISVIMNVTATYPSVNRNTSAAVDVDIGDSNGDTATATTSVDIQNLATGGEGTGDGTVGVALQPGTQNVSAGGTTTYEIVLENVDNGVGSYEFSVTTGNTSVATITDVTLQGTTGSSLTNINIASDGSQAEVVASNTDTANTGTVTVAIVTVTGQASGTADLSLSLLNGNAPGDESGNTYSVSSVTGASVMTRAGPGDVTGNGQSATDPDGDGIYEDVNGDGSVTASDVTALFNALINGDTAITQGPFDINNEGDGVSGADVTTMFNAVLNGQIP